MGSPELFEIPPFWWCNSHQRPALLKTRCDPKLGGILLPCFTVNLTGFVEYVPHQTMANTG